MVNHGEPRRRELFIYDHLDEVLDQLQRCDKMVFEKTRKAIRNRIDAAKRNSREFIDDAKDRSLTEAMEDALKNDGEANRRFVKDLRG